MRGEEILLPLRFGEGWGGVFRIYAKGLVKSEKTLAADCDYISFTYWDNAIFKLRSPSDSCTL